MEPISSGVAGAPTTLRRRSISADGTSCASSLAFICGQRALKSSSLARVASRSTNFARGLYADVRELRAGEHRGADPLLLFKRLPVAEARLDVKARIVEGKYLLVHAAHEEREHADLDSMRDDLSLERVVAHLQEMAEHVLRAGRRTRTLHVLHGEAAEHQALDEASQRLGLHRDNPLGVADRGLEPVLHGMPRRVVPLSCAELVGEYPVRPGRNLRHQVGEAARGHPLRGSAHDVEVRDDRARRGTRIGLLRALGAP